MNRWLPLLAWRSLWLNPRRTLIAMTAIAVGYAMLLFVACLMAGLRHQMILSGTGLVLGEIELHAPGYYPDRPPRLTLGGRGGTDVNALLDKLVADPRVTAASPRVYGAGLVSASHQSAGVQLLGIDPGREPAVTTLHSRIVSGHYLAADQPQGVVMGDKLASTIGVTVGSSIVLLTTAADGSLGNDLGTVTGLFHTGLDSLDQGLVLLPLAALQGLLHLEPEQVHEVALKLHDLTTAGQTAAALEPEINHLLPVELRAWPVLAPELADYVQFNLRVTFILFFIFFLSAAIGIVNTMLMAIIERTRELGMLMAIGLRPLQMVGLIVTEAAALAAASLLLGLALATPLLWSLERYGLNLNGAGGEVSVAGIVVGPLWYGRQDFAAYAEAALGLALTALASALYPAVRAARLRPAEALRKV